MLKFNVRTLKDIYARTAQPITRNEHENNYRRGYADGFIAALNLLGQLWFLRRRQRIEDALYDHWEHALHDWQRGTDGDYLPPFWPRQARCVYCGEPASELDHVVPKSKGGSNSYSNLVPSCGPCNRSKGARTPDEWMGS